MFYMRKIGEGYYYNVFSVDNSKVIKRIKNKPRIFLFIIFANKFNISNTIIEYRNVLRAIHNLKDEYLKILTLINNKELIGNPDFINNTDYKQDKVSELRNINTLKNQDFIKIVNDYTTLLKTLWSFKISDAVFNFSLNCGYNSRDQLILIDFNEMTFDKNKVTNQIKKKEWLQRSSYLRLNTEKKIIFEEIMDKEINTKNLEKLWL